MTTICACGARRKGFSGATGRSASGTQGLAESAPPGPNAEGGAKSVVTSAPCPFFVSKMW